MARILTLLKSRGFQKGVMGASRGWFAVWIALAVAKRLSKMLGDTPVVERVVLKPGQTIEIQDTSLTWGDVAKASKRRSKKAAAKQTAVLSASE